MAKATFSGPGGTTYTQAAKTSRGRLGVAKLGDGSVRIRVEPSSDEAVQKMAPHLKNWTQPEDGNRRFSIVTDLKKGTSLFNAAKKAIKTDSGIALKDALPA